MSFTSDIKSEIVKIKLKQPRCRLMQLAGIVFACGSIRLGGAMAVTVRTENYEVARHASSLVKGLYELDTAMEESRQEHRRAPLYEVKFSGEGVLPFLRDSGFLSEDENGIGFAVSCPVHADTDEEEAHAFIRGCFLGTGSCSNPAESYSCELICPTESFARELSGVILEMGIMAKLCFRRGKWVIYMRDGDSVTGFLAVIGSHSAALGFENVRAEKETRNYVNRMNNCENANLDKTIDAACRQKAAIEYIIRRDRFRTLSPALRETAELRLDNPEATLQELADLANIKKSGMNHRLTRLVEMAEDIEKGLQ